MNNIIFSGLADAPKGKKALAVQLAYCFFVCIIVLTVISSVVTSAYVSMLERERADAMMLTASSSAVVLSGMPIELGMENPLPAYKYDDQKEYFVNIYVHAHSSFIRVYSSDEEEQMINPETPVTLEGGSEEHIKAYQLEKIGMVRRVEEGRAYYAAIAPIMTESGGVSGIIEIMMPEEDFGATVNGFSLSWIFTIISISISFTLVYYQIHRLILTVAQKPDRQLPKIIRYGLNGCKLIAFFSAAACVMPPLISSVFIRQTMHEQGYTDLFSYLYVLIGLVLYAMGFFGFRSIRVILFKRFTSRLATAISAMLLFALLLLTGLISNVYLLLIMILPISFFSGMIFYFQREYRVYAGRLGHEGFEETIIHRAQFSSQVYGAIVGTVVAGMLFERLGLFPVYLLSGSLLLIVSVLALLFVQHCPSSKEPPLHLTRFLYALINRNSGSFLWSTLVTSGVQLAFFIGFVPIFLKSVGISLATVSFYYLIFAVCCCVFSKVLEVSQVYLWHYKSRVLISSIIQILGYLALAIIPSAKMLVVTACLLGVGMAVLGHGHTEYYSKLIREDKRQYARNIVERAFSTGVIFGAFVFGLALFFLSQIRMPLLIFVAIFAFVALSNSIVGLSSSGKNKSRSSESSQTSSSQTDRIEPATGFEQHEMPFDSYEIPQDDNQYGYDDNSGQERGWGSYVDTDAEYPSEGRYSDFEEYPFGTNEQGRDDF